MDNSLEKHEHPEQAGIAVTQFYEGPFPPPDPKSRIKCTQINLVQRHQTLTLEPSAHRFIDSKNDSFERLNFELCWNVLLWGVF